MDKITYLNKLKEALKDTEEPIMEEIVADYEEHFTIGAQNGKSEEEICEDLGNIEDLVEEIKEVYHTDSSKNKETKEDESNGDTTNEQNKKTIDFHFNIPNIDGEKIGGAINNALDSAGDAISKIDVMEIGHALKNTWNQAASSINNFTDNYFKTHAADSADSESKDTQGYNQDVSTSYDIFEEAGENVAKPQEGAFAKEEENQTEHLENQPSTENEESENKKENSLNLVIDGICADVVVRKSQDNKVNISYENKGTEGQKQLYEFYSYREGDTIHAGLRKLGKGVFLFHLGKVFITIYVELPDYISRMDIKTVSGNVQVTETKADRMTISTVSGTVQSVKTYATDLRIKSTSGDITLENVNSIQLQASSMSGDISADYIDTKFLSLKSISGDIKTGNIAAEIMDDSSQSGDLKLRDIKTGECKLRSTSGQIVMEEAVVRNTDASTVSGKIKFQNITADGLRASSISGSVSLNINAKRCHASSKSGNVTVECENDILLESNSTSGTIRVVLKNSGNGYVVNSRTTSGSLNVDYSNNLMKHLRTGTYTYGNQGSELTVATVSGNIHLTD